MSDPIVSAQTALPVPFLHELRLRRPDSLTVFAGALMLPEPTDNSVGFVVFCIV